MPIRQDSAALSLRDELSRQAALLDREAPVRAIAILIAFAISSAFLPLWVVLVCALIVAAGEATQFQLQRDIVRLTEPARYRLYIAAAFMTESGFALPPALVWHIEDPYVKAFAVGLMVCSMLHIATVRSIHLPMGLTGASSVILLTMGTNLAYWLPREDMQALAVTTLCALVAIGYSVGAIMVTNRLHRETAKGRADALAANATKDRFLAQMSHELRTPLNAILGMGHAELRRTADPISRERLSVLITSAEGLSTILDDILDMSAVQEGRLPIRPRVVTPRDEIAATVELFRPSIEDAGLTLHVDLAADLPARARFDPQRLRQCLSNLLSNALKHTTEGSIRVSAAVSPTPGGPLLRIEVQDTGNGIASDREEAIFQPFTRRSGDVSATAGNGLGLSISRALARQMGGDLLVLPASAQRPGAHFVLTLSIAIVTPAAASEAVQPSVPADPQSLAGRTILVVDDIATNRLVAAAYLGLFGARAVEAAGGAAAVDLLGRTAIDLVLLDMNMPEMDGVETYRHIRALPGPAGRIPVVAMTADAMEDQRAAYLAQGLDGYVAKPVTPDRIARELQRVLAAASSAPTTPG